ncbi:MAG: sulfatase-like hydrolase/transferase [Candidatus Poribacteria bacterium]|jgi:arylsulfatase A-like enzyme|nr:sulfatase-like hydrolase/transferase [Candidatus Poribacteria bacterium]MDP6747957.1 sulfatase-like hydrolase/transferase [Candidatus Poribacteria bacterium]MDP6995547.1 sulfatase-like hydrolase/transferase [Candidatus Poribacteria bacterium]
MKRRPNIILILADDLGYGDPSSYNGQHLNTPNIDALADGGLKFTDFHANAPVCSPTRAALMTGRYQQRSGIEGVISARNHRDKGLAGNQITMAQILKQVGYATAIYGKWHLGYQPRFNPNRFGFDEFRGFVSGNVDYHSHIDQIGQEDWWENLELQPEEGYSTDLITQHGLSFIKRHADQPFFLYLAHECPHYPYQGRNDPADRSIGNPHPVHGSRTDRKEAYKEMMEAMDEGIGQIVATVERLGLAHDTLIFFCSDNGPVNPGSSGGLRGQKGALWEGGHRVPAIAYCPSRIPAKGVTTQTTVTFDLLPTFAHLAQAPIPDNWQLDGLNLWPLMGRNESLAERSLFWRFNDRSCIRRGDWKLMSGEDGGLFNLAQDLSESVDLASKHPQLVRELQAELDQWNQTVSDDVVRQS